MHNSFGLISQARNMHMEIQPNTPWAVSDKRRTLEESYN